MWVAVCMCCMHIHMSSHLRAYVWFFLGGEKNVGLAFLQEERLLKVFTADSYFIRRGGCRKLKCSDGMRGRK